MSLAEFVSREFDVPLKHIMLLRHSNATVDRLLAAGGSVEEYTFTQPTASSYDYTHPRKDPVRLVVVIVRDRIYGVYEVLGVEKEGTTYSLTSSAHQRFDRERGIPPKPAKRFAMKALGSVAVGLPVTGWENRSRTPVQRIEGSFFLDIDVPEVTETHDGNQLQQRLEDQVRESLRSDGNQRRNRLVLAPKLPRRVRVTLNAFVRNPDVIAEVLLRAKGICELCGAPAPFARRTDGKPYLEVHHKVKLADGGEDTVENAVAVCPNCHRREHYA